MEKPITTESEQKLIDAAAKGEVADFSDPDPAANDPAKGAGWGAERTVRAQVLRTLCLGSNPEWALDPRGILVVGARIAGALDMDSAIVPVPLSLCHCFVEQDISFLDASTRTISLQGSHVRGILADRVVINGGLFLSDGFNARGAVRLGGAKIGSLDCSKARVENPQGDALFADQLNASYYVFLRNFCAKGEVRFQGANIEGSLDCDGATLLNPNGTALNAQRIRTGKDVFLRNRFRADGEVSLIGAEIGGDLDCQNAAFRGAFMANQIKTAGGVLIKNACFEGAVRLLGAVVGAALDCTGTSLKNASGDVLSIEGTTISGVLRWRPRPPIIGGVVFAQAKVGRLVDNPDSWPEPEKLILDGFVYSSFAGNELVDLKARLNWLNLQPTYRFWSQPYAQLASVLHAMGQERDARSVSIAKEKAFIKYGGASWWQRCWLYFLGVTVGYGYKPGRVLWWFLGLVTVGSIIFWYAGSQAAMAPVKDATARTMYIRNAELPAGYPHFYPFIYSLDVALPIIDLQQDGYWTPNQDTLPGQVARWWLWAEILFGWILVTVGIAGITGVIKKH